MDMRELKALEIAARSKVTFDGKTWVVPSQSGTGTYRVRIGAEPSCTCEDFQLRQKPCKHVMACRLVSERDHGGNEAPKIVTDAVPKKVQVKRDWVRYDEAQTTEKDRFLELLNDLCRGIEEPRGPKKAGRPKTPLADQIFSAAFKVYSTVSFRRFGCDLYAAHEKGYVSELVNPRRISAYLENPALAPVLERLIVQSSLPLRTVETVFAPDSTGFSTSRFVRWYDEKYGAERSGKEWVKAHAICGVRTNIVTAVVILGKDAADCPQFKPLVETTAENFKIGDVVADKAYLSNENLALVDQLGGTAFVPFKSNSVAGKPDSLWERMFHYYSYRREDFLKRYHQRSNIESTFSMIKAKFRDHVRSKTDVAMKNEVLCKFLCHNICVVHQSAIELGIETQFWATEQPEETSPGIIKFRPKCGA